MSSTKIVMQRLTCSVVCLSFSVYVQRYTIVSAMAKKNHGACWRGKHTVLVQFDMILWIVYVFLNLSPLLQNVTSL